MSSSPKTNQPPNSVVEPVNTIVESGPQNLRPGDRFPNRNRKPRYRRPRRRALKAQGILPTIRSFAWCVVVNDTKILPTWLKDHLIPGLSSVNGMFWLRPAAAASLAAMMHTIRVGYRITKTELKHCEVCGRPTVGTEAEQLRRQMESAVGARQLPCGPNCARDNASGLWRKLKEGVAA